jgi:hypothetical protein
MGELKAAVDGCEVVVRFDEDTEFSPALAEALAAVAEAMHAQQLEEAEVSGFGLTVGGLGLSPRGPVSRGARDCWGYEDGGHCGWYSDDPEDRQQPGGPTSCTIRNF